MTLGALGRRLTGLLGLLAIVAIAVGLPILLLQIGADPIPSAVPSWDQVVGALTSPDDGTLLLWLVKVAAWASWAFLTFSLIVEILARLRGVRAPRLRGLSLPQGAARGLVSVATMLFIAVPLGTTAAQAASPPPAAVAAPLAPALSSISAQDASTTTPRVEETTESRPAATVTHTVKRGQTLWSIAQDELGDGHRWKQIHDLNRDVLGERPGFLQPGWQLQLPADAPQNAPATADPQEVTVEPGDTLWGLAEEHSGDGARYPEIFEASDQIAQPDGQYLTDPDLIHPGWTLHVPATADIEAATEADAPATSSPSLDETPQGKDTTAADTEVNPGEGMPTPESTERDGPAEQGAEAPPAALVNPQAEAEVATPGGPTEGADDAPWMARTSYGVGALLAAGVLALLVGRRGEQQRRRKPGQRLPVPGETAALLEQDIRAVADPLSVETVDQALRSLARHCADTDTPLPVVRAGRLTATQFDLYLADAAELPEPWSGTADGTVWTLSVDDLPTAADDGADHAVPAPYPTLVTVGHDEEDGHVLLDLEHLGALAVFGDEEATGEVLAALAVELATSEWADDLQITIVGAYADLEDSLRTGRIRYLPSVSRILDDLERRAAADRAALDESGTTLQHARVRGIVPDSWAAPEIVILAGPVTDQQRTRLENLVDDLPRVALAAVTTGAPAGQWVLDLDGADGEDPTLAVLEPIGLMIRPQRVPVERYRDLLEIATLTDVEELTGEADVGAEPTPEVLASITPVDDETEEATTAVDDALASATPAPDLVPAAIRAEASAVDSQEDGPDNDAQDDGEQSVDGVDHTGEPSHAEHADDVEPIDDESEAAEKEAAGSVEQLRLPAPRILMMGPVQMVQAGGPVEPSKQARLLEYAAYLVLNPAANHSMIDDAIWPDRKSDDNLNTRNTATSKLRRWVGATPDGEDYLPRHQAGEGYAFHPEVTSDVHEWSELVGDDPLKAPTESLERALGLVRGRPFHTTKGHKRYAWAEPLKQRLIAEIVDAAYELARRRLMEGRWRAAEQAVVTALAIEPAQESLWRLRILAAHESRDTSAVDEAIARLMAITEQLECDLEPETEALLDALKQPHAKIDHLIASI